MYQRHTPKRTARTVAQIREEAAKKQKEDREARKEEADRKRRAADHKNEETGCTDPPEIVDITEAMPGSNKKKRSSLPVPNQGPSDRGEGASASAAVGDGPTCLTTEITSAEPTKSLGQGQGTNQQNQVSANPTGEGIDTNLRNFLLSIKDELKTSTAEAVNKFDKRIERAEASIAELGDRIDRGNKDLDGKIVKCVREEVAKVAKTAGAVALSAPTSTRREEAYHRCRRSLKIWPIEGDCLEDEVKVFLSTRLKFQDQRIQMMGKLMVTGSRGKAAADRKEVIVLFEDRDDRDAVKAAGFNLADQREAGMAIHVPGHLLDNLFALNSVGYSIKTKSESAVKRAVKFDDAKLDLYLDICIGNVWKRITPAEAKTVLKRVPPASAADSRSITIEELTGLVQGNASVGLNAVVVPADDELPASQ